MALAWIGWAVAGLTLAGAVLLAAVLSPTDPVLAGDLQVGPPLEGGEQPVRLALTTEAGLNDGLAFPFVLLGLAIAVNGFAPGSWVLEWLAVDVVYRIAVGAASGAALGWLLGKIVFAIPRDNSLARTESGVVALAGVLVCYGATELVAGLRIRRRVHGGLGVAARGAPARVPSAPARFQRGDRARVDRRGADHARRRATVVVAGARVALSRGGPACY